LCARGVALHQLEGGRRAVTGADGLVGGQWRLGRQARFEVAPVLEAEAIEATVPRLEESDDGGEIIGAADGRRRTIVLPEEAVEILKRIPRSNRSDYIFWNGTDNGFYQDASNLFWQYARRPLSARDCTILGTLLLWRSCERAGRSTV
jgi:hypothetical protein